MSYKLIKPAELSPESIGRVKSKTVTYQIDETSTLYDAIKKCLSDNELGIRGAKITGKLTIHLHLGGILGIELVDTERSKVIFSIK